VATAIQLQVHLERHHHPNPKNPQAQARQGKTPLKMVFPLEDLIISALIII